MKFLSLKTENIFKLAAIAGFFFMVALFSFFLWNFFTAPSTLNTEIKDFEKAGTSALSDLQALPGVALIEEGESYVIQDDLSEGVEISYPGNEEQEEKPKTKVSLPKDYAEPIEIKLDNERTITLQDENGGGYSSDVLSETSEDVNATWLQKIFGSNKGEKSPTYLRYQNDRKSILYSYQRDRASGERKLKHWTFYEEGAGEERESYSVENARLEKNENGEIELFYQTEQDLKNQAVAKEVDPSLMERAMKTLEKEGVNQENRSPDLLIPKPYYYDKDGGYHEADWEIDGNRLILAIKTSAEMYPLAVDPTLFFTAPGRTNTGVTVDGESGSYFGRSLATGDLNADGKVDLAVGAYASSTGRAYVFYNDGAYSDRALTADVIITGEASSSFGISLATGDLNADGKVDLAVGAYASSTGRAYIFYNDGSIPTTAATADVIITGEASSSFGISLTTGDLNADGKADLVVGANEYSSTTGRAYIFYNDGSIPTTAATADVIITGEASSSFGISLTTGDLNADGKADLVVGADEYSSSTGRAYIFYNDGSIPTTAATADVIITGEVSSSFGYSLATGDLNADGEADLVVGSYLYSTNTGRAYIFYNDGSIPTTALTANRIITGEASSSFGTSLATGDLNADGKADLVVGAYQYTSSTGRAYILYNDGDGTYPTTALTADVIITGEVGSSFSFALATGDMNVDGKIDLIVGGLGYNVFAGRTYIFYSQNGVLSTNRSITGETGGSGSFGWSMAVGDLNADGRTDLVVGAQNAASNGRAYIFYNDGAMPSTGATADVIITGEVASNLFGVALATGDVNADGKTDLIVGASVYSTSTGRAYIFYNGSIITENASGADIFITGETTSNVFGAALVTGDFNADGEIDLAVGAYANDAVASNAGRVYIFYNGSIITENASGADVFISGEAANNSFGIVLIAGDLNADGKKDLIVSASSAATNGRVYVFYNDGSYPTAAVSGDALITGEAGGSFGTALAVGDLNADGKTDLIASAVSYSTSTGRAYIFYNGSITTENVSGADIFIAGETTSTQFGYYLATGDLNADGRIDLAVGAPTYTTNTGRAYIFYNDGSIPTTAATADAILIGETTNNYFGSTLVTGDFNADGETDLVVAAYGYSSNAGRTYFYEGQRNFSWQLQSQPLGTSRISSSVLGEVLHITGEATSALLGSSVVAGDFNADGVMDLAAGAPVYSTNTGRAYVFYGGNDIATSAASADVTIVGENTSNLFGLTLTAGDLNSDGKTDLLVGARQYTSETGRAYIFYNDGSIPTTAATADVIITGEATTNYFAYALATGDLNADGKTDLIVGAYGYTTSTGRAYIFYNDGSIPTTAATADVIITGEATSNSFGAALTTGDLNADGKVDLTIGASGYTTNTGRAYIFYNDGSIPTTAATADVIITGEATSNSFGAALTTGDLNADGEVDLAIGASGYSSSAGRAYIFYNDGSIPTTAATADVIITGESSSAFGGILTIGDINADGRVDLVVGAESAVSSAGRAYIFYNDGSIPTTAATADVVITGEGTEGLGKRLAMADFNVDGKSDLVVTADEFSSNRGRVYIYTMNDSVISGASSGDYFGYALAAGDLNADGKLDLAVGAYGYSTNTGRAYVFYGGSALDASPSTADITITGEASSDFGEALTVVDINANSTADLVVGAGAYSSSTGRAYIFYNDGSIPTTAATADVIITGETSSGFGSALEKGDFNADGEVDLAIGASGYTTNTGRAYIFYNDGSIPTTAATADVIITGEATSNYFGETIKAGDLNADGKTDILIGAYGYDNNKGRAYIFYNDGSIPTTAATADVIITGHNVTNTYFAHTLAIGDLNADGKQDVIVGTDTITSSTYTQVYIFYNDGSYPTSPSSADLTINNVSEGTGWHFGSALAVGDMNADGRLDLIVGNRKYNSTSGRAYIFYNDGSISTTASEADKVITGQGTLDYLGASILTGDFDANGIADLVVAAFEALNTNGEVYVYSTETRTSANSTYTRELTPDGNNIGASLKSGTIKVKAGTIQVK